MNTVFSLMLHSHIPYCRKSGVWPAGEEWLFEAMSETYLPLLMILRQFQMDYIRPRLMIGVVPVLAEQLADEYMKARFCRYMEEKIVRARSDAGRFRDDPSRRAMALYWLDRFQRIYRAYSEEFYRDILGTLKWLQDEGLVEIVTSAATHGLLPLMERDSSVFGQVRVGVETYRRYFSRNPRGFWLPECAYRPGEWSSEEGRMRKGIDEWLADEGIEYFFVESHGLTGAQFIQNLFHEPAPTTDRGYRLSSGIAVFGRNEATGRQVWSAPSGYPGDPNYLEFHCKDSESGLRYWKVTGCDQKGVYDVDRALERVNAHADHFISLLDEEGERAGQRVFEAPPVVVSPYDCELFGHWWHEGILWIDRLFRKLALEKRIRCMSLGDYLEQYGRGLSTIKMGSGTWGMGGDFVVWRNEEHGWVWPYINSSSKEAEAALRLLGEEGQRVDERTRRILRQLVRELLLLQGSDWPFLLFTAQAKEYANQRFHHHHQRLHRLLWAAKEMTDKRRLSDGELQAMEDVDSVWPEIDYELFRQRI
jgi:1,4-alpha-glucan branching enzyme